MNKDSAAHDISRRAHRRLLTALMMSTALYLGVFPAVLPVPQAAAQTARAHSFNIPRQPLNRALRSLADQTGIQIAYQTSIAAGTTAPAVTGTMSTEQALALMLSGSGLRYSFTNANTVTILDATMSAEAGSINANGSLVLDTINVQGQGANPNSTMAPMEPYAGGQVARGGQVGMLGNRDVMNTPFSQTNYTNKTIKDQQAQTVQDVLSNDPSILTKQNSPSDEDASMTIRGFSTGHSSGFGSLNGLPGMAPLRSPDMNYIERVEVLRGPSALLNGMAASGAGGVGGSYNLVTKQADDEPLTELTTGYISNSQLGAHVDFGRRFGENKQFGMRFNGAFRKGDTSVDPISAEVGSAALNLDYRSERVRLSADIFHQMDEASPQILQQLSASGARGGVAFIPEAPDAGTSLHPEWSEQRSRLTGGMVRGEVDITDNVTAYGAIGKQKLDLTLIGPSQPTLRNVDGTFGWNSAEYSNYSYDVLSMQGGLRATASTGSVDHALSLNLSQSWMENGSAEFSTPYTYTTNLYNPIFGPAPFLTNPGDPKKTSESRVSSIGVADTLSILDERIQFTAGIRYQEVASDNFNTTTGDKTSSYDGKAWTPAFGLVVKPWENVSLYANYIENLQRGTIVGTSYANAGEVFPPYVSKQYEAGVKVDWGTVTTTLAAFQIAQPNTIAIDDPIDPVNNPQTLTLDGEQRNRGIELNAYGEFMPGLRLMGGVTLLDARLTKTQGGLNDGNRADGSARIRTVVGAEWDTPFLQGLTLTGRITYTGDQIASSSRDDLKIPSWTVVDLGARYTFDSPWNDKPITVRFNVDNVFDKDYWSGTNTRYIQLGAPRTFRLSTAFQF